MAPVLKVKNVYHRPIKVKVGNLEHVLRENESFDVFTVFFSDIARLESMGVLEVEYNFFEQLNRKIEEFEKKLNEFEKRLMELKSRMEGPEPSSKKRRKKKSESTEEKSE